jgi:hypothetical protein
VAKHACKHPSSAAVGWLVDLSWAAQCNATEEARHGGFGFLGPGAEAGWDRWDRNAGGRTLVAGRRRPRRTGSSGRGGSWA